MAKDVQNKQLGEWLQLMGCPVELSSEELSLLNSPSMRSVWRHLQNHIKPKNSVRTIRRNLLLAKLRNSDMSPGKLRGGRIETVQELVMLQDLSGAQDQVDGLKDQTASVDESLLSEVDSLTTKVTERELLTERLREIEEKSLILKLKVDCVKKDTEKLDKELEIATILDPCASNQMHSETKESKMLVSNFVKKFSLFENAEDDYIDELIVSTLGLPPSIILDGILSVSNHALKSLSSYKFADFCPTTNLPNPKDELNLKSSKPFENLHVSVFKHELELHLSVEKLTENKSELDKEKVALYQIVEKTFDQDHPNYVNYESPIELIDTILENTMMIKKEEKLKDLQEELRILYFSDFLDTKGKVSNLKESEDKIFKELNEKLCDMNKLIESIFKSEVGLVKSEVSQKVTSIVSDFLSQLNHEKDRAAVYQDLVSEDLIGKEIEMFQKCPLKVMTREWEDSHEMIPSDVKQDILKTPELLFLLQEEPKNIIRSIVEKNLWLHANYN